MKKGWIRYFLAEIITITLVAGFFLLSSAINARRVYRMPVSALLSLYKANPEAFIKKYNKHGMYVTGRVNFVFEKGTDDYVYKQGILYTGSFVQLMDPAILPESDPKELYENSIRCGFYNKNLKMFQNIDFLDPMNKIIMTIKGTLYVDNEEILLVDCIKVEEKTK